MFLLIDKDRMAFVAKHPDRVVLGNLATIELGFSYAAVLPLEFRAFDSFTHTELTLLYQNTTGHKFSGFSYLHLCEMVYEVAKAVPVADINSFEVCTQAAYCKGNKTERFRYVKGASVPALEQELFVPEPVAGIAPVTLTATAPAPQRGPVATPVAATVLAPAKTAPKGGVSALIYEVADKIWTAAGCPTKTPAVLELRKQMMKELEELHGVKKSTSSNALGQWQKLRVH